jgi:hypothetical protein
MRETLHFCTCLIFAAAVCVLAGCADRYDGRLAVSGNVTLEGAPLDGGTITFEPVDGQGSTSGAAIENGEYTIDRKVGLKPGKYRVAITAGDGKTPASEDEAASPGGGTNIVSVDRIPPEYNERSKQQVEVKADGPNKFDFAIPKAREIKAKKGKR